MELQAIQPWSDFKLTAATDGKGNQVSGDLSTQVFATGSGKYLVPTQFSSETAGYTNASVSAKFDVTYDLATASLSSGTEYTYGTNGKYVASADGDKAVPAEVAAAYFSGNLKNGGSPVAVSAGAYSVKLTAKDGSITQTVGFGIGTPAAQQLKVTDAEGNASFTFDGVEKSLTVKNADGTAVSEKYDADRVDASGKVVATVTGLGNGAIEVLDAGKYVVYKNGDSSKTVVASFEVAKLDLGSASLTHDDVTSIDAEKLLTFKANGKEVSVGNGSATFDGPSANLTAKGEYTVTVKAKDEAVNFTGTGSYKLNHVDSVVTLSGASYGRNAIKGDVITVAKGGSFDASKLSVTDGTTTYSGGKLELTYTKDGKAFDAASAKAGDVFQVNAKLKAFTKLDGGAQKLVGSTVKTVTVKMSTSVAYDDQLGFYLDGKLAGSKGTVTYDGTDQLKRLTATIKDDGGNTLVEGTDYTLEVKNDKDVVVTEAVNAGVYKIEVKGKGYEIDGNDHTFTLTVAQANVSGTYDYVADAPKGKDDKGGEVTADASLYYTGSDIATPAYKYYVLDSKGAKTTDADGDYVVADVAADAYNVVSVIKDGKQVDAIKAAGTYTVNVAFKDGVAGNYKNSTGSFKVTVKKAQSFADVAPEAWYAGAVEAAYNQNYVNGISGTNLFAPENSITRADAVGILFNMAGGDSANGANDFQYSENYGYDTGFNDVDGKAYYAKALAWAHKAGIVNGDDGDFRPTDSLTREEFAAMLANYAKNLGKYEAADAGALDAVSDADTVSGWATESVAWAVENHVMGNGGEVRADQKISRAEVAAMGVNYQPKNLDPKKQTRQ